MVLEKRFVDSAGTDDNFLVQDVSLRNFQTIW